MYMSHVRNVRELRAHARACLALPAHSSASNSILVRGVGRRSRIVPRSYHAGSHPDRGAPASRARAYLRAARVPARARVHTMTHDCTTDRGPHARRHARQSCTQCALECAHPCAPLRFELPEADSYPAAIDIQSIFRGSGPLQPRTHSCSREGYLLAIEAYCRLPARPVRSRET